MPSAARSKQCRRYRLAALHPGWAAIAAVERAAHEQFGLHIVSHAIQDEAYNRTRFAIICLPHTRWPRLRRTGKELHQPRSSPCPTAPCRP